MADTLATRLKAIAEKSTTPEGDKATLLKLADKKELTAPELTAYLGESRLPEEDKKTIAEQAAKLTEEHKWLTPRELEEASITDKDHAHPFIEWASELQEQKRAYDNNPQSAAKLTEVERRAIEVATRLTTYKAYSGEGFQANAILLAMPRPNSKQYLAATAKTMKEARDARAERKDPRACRCSSSTSSRRSRHSGTTSLVTIATTPPRTPHSTNVTWRGCATTRPGCRSR